MLATRSKTGLNQVGSSPGVILQPKELLKRQPRGAFDSGPNLPTRGRPLPVGADGSTSRPQPESTGERRVGTQLWWLVKATPEELFRIVQRLANLDPDGIMLRDK